MLIVILVTVAALVGAARHAPPEPRAPFDTKLLRRLKKEAPDFVLLGNSMVDTRFDTDELDRLLAPKRTVVVGVGGSKSAFWYLALKNVILRATKPTRVFLFFRRRELTSPRENATGPYAYTLGRVSREVDAVVAAKLAPLPTERLDRIGYELARFAPFDRLRALGVPVVTAWTRTLSGALSPSEQRRQDAALEKTFAVGALRDGIYEPATALPEKGEFGEAVDASLLPDIVELLARAKVPLTVVRVRTRVAAKGRYRPSSYDRALDSYLAHHGVELIDMSDAAWESLDLYGEGDHIAPRYRARYTRLFVEHWGRTFR